MVDLSSPQTVTLPEGYHWSFTNGSNRYRPTLLTGRRQYAPLGAPAARWCAALCVCTFRGTASACPVCRLRGGWWLKASLNETHQNNLFWDVCSMFGPFCIKLFTPDQGIDARCAENIVILSWISQVFVLEPKKPGQTPRFGTVDSCWIGWRVVPLFSIK